MAHEHRETVRYEDHGDYQRKQRIVEHTPSTQQVIVSRVSQLIWLFDAIVIGLIGFRFIFKLIAANAANPFVSLIYGITDALIAPFVGIIPVPAAQGSVFSVPSLIAMVVYLLVAAVLVALIRVLFSDDGSRHTVKTVERSR